MPRKQRARHRDRALKLVAFAAVFGIVALINVPLGVSYARNQLSTWKLDSQSYKTRAGHWSTLVLPAKYRVNAIHAVLLRTGKVLIIAGSGNDRGKFDAGKFESLLWDPATDHYKLIATPSDMFCGGHVVLPDGKVLVAGGTQRYEVLAADVTRAAGVVTVKNENPDLGPILLPKGTGFVSPNGIAFRSTSPMIVGPATKVSRGNRSVIVPSATETWVEAAKAGSASVIAHETHLGIDAVALVAQHNVYAIAQSLTRGKQEFQGINSSYLFDPVQERYERVGNLTLKRWYPTLVGLADGKVLAVSGLDGFGQLIQGTNEIYDPATEKWSVAPGLHRTFPTYPALFLLADGRLFYSGSNAGYGSTNVGRTPGIWNLANNTFGPVRGLRDSEETETSGSVLLPPAQRQKVLVVGGGGVGESAASTNRSDVIDLTQADPHFVPGPLLEAGTRYPGLVITPDDDVLVTGGSQGYRGTGTPTRPGNSDLPYSYLYDPRANGLTRIADSHIGRDYHSEALLLPDGRIATLGGNPLYDDTGKHPGVFEQRIEIYSPPYLYHGRRPTLSSAPTELERGASASVNTIDATPIATMRLIRPSAVTHVTDVEQRSIAVSFTQHGNTLDFEVPSGPGLVPSGWYMLFVTNRRGTPSIARWVHVQ
jgi:hypothetical protein